MDGNVTNESEPQPPSDPPVDSHWVPLLGNNAFCYHCGNSRTVANPLKRCGGCGKAMYCNKDCQKAAWSSHRKRCGESTSAKRLKELGYNSISLSDTVHQWMAIHAYTLNVIAQVALYTNGGVEYNLSTPHAVVYLLDILSDGSGKRLHPSRAFRVVGADVFHKDHNPILDALWEVEHVEHRERMLKLWQGEGERFTHNRSLAGAFPTAFFMKSGNGTGWYSCCDVYHSSRRRDRATLDEPTRLAFEDLDMMCRRSILGGMIYEAPEDHTQILPTAAVYLPSENGWRRISAPDMLASSVAQDRLIHPTTYISGLSLEKIWEIYKNW